MNATRLRAGAAVSNLTPPLGVSLDGPILQSGPAAHGHDELTARCLVLDDGRTQFAFVVCDCTMTGRLPDRDEVCWAEGVFARSAGQAPLTRPEVYARETVLMKDWNPRAEFVVQDLRVGEVGIAALPCEVFAETGLAIKEHSRQRPSSTIELANGQSGYLPTPAQHKLGGYETWRARSSFLEAEPKPKLRSKALELLGEPAPKKGRG